MNCPICNKYHDPNRQSPHDHKEYTYHNCDDHFIFYNFYNNNPIKKIVIRGTKYHIFGEMNLPNPSDIRIYIDGIYKPSNAIIINKNIKTIEDFLIPEEKINLLVEKILLLK